MDTQTISKEELDRKIAEIKAYMPSVYASIQRKAQEIGSKADDASILLLPYQADKAMLHAVIREARALLGYKK